MNIPGKKPPLTLEVKKAQWFDVYKDVARIHHSHRDGLKKGRVYLLTVNAKSEYIVIRGHKESGIITLDYEMRERFGVEIGDSCTITLTETFLWAPLYWAWNATDPSYRIATKLAVYLGGLGVTLGLLSLILSCFGALPINGG